MARRARWSPTNVVCSAGTSCVRKFWRAHRCPAWTRRSAFSSNATRSARDFQFVADLHAEFLRGACVEFEHVLRGPDGRVDGAVIAGAATGRHALLHTDQFVLCIKV